MELNISIIGFGKNYSNQIRELLIRSNSASSINTVSDTQTANPDGCENTDAIVINGYSKAGIQWLRNCIHQTGSKPPASLIIGNPPVGSITYEDERRNAPRIQITHKELTARKLTHSLEQLLLAKSQHKAVSYDTEETLQSIDERQHDISSTLETNIDLHPQLESLTKHFIRKEITHIGDYKINQLLGNGGMGTVYQAQSSDNETVAIKLIDSNKVTDDRLLDRFIKEYELLARVDHPHVILVHEQGFTDSHLYIVMELLTSESLKSRIQKNLSLENAIKYAINICHAIATIHDLGILHRDIKPINILFDHNDQPVITDFGIAKVTEQAGDVELTMQGEAIGTPAYMSPEQALGNEVTPSSDLYSFGVMLYQMVTRQLPFRSKRMIEVMQHHVTTPPPHLPSELMDLDPIIQRLLKKNPRLRYQSAWELHAELEQFSRSLG